MKYLSLMLLLSCTDGSFKAGECFMYDPLIYPLRYVYVHKVLPNDHYMVSGWPHDKRQIYLPKLESVLKIDCSLVDSKYKP